MFFFAPATILLCPGFVAVDFFGIGPTQGALFTYVLPFQQAGFAEFMLTTLDT